MTAATKAESACVDMARGSGWERDELRLKREVERHQFKMKRRAITCLQRKAQS